MAKRSSLRASDADRERVTERLRHAVTDGRLLAHEFEERVSRALRARTYGELDDVVADLPPTPAGVERRGPTHLQRAWRHPLIAVGMLVLAATVFTAVLAAAVLVAVLMSMALLILRGRRLPFRQQFSRLGEPQMRMYARRYSRF